MSSTGTGGWRSKVLQSRWPWLSQAVRPADVSDGLNAVMLARENILEDAYYRKIVPNRYIVEVSEVNYNRNYRSIAGQLTGQWRSRLLEELTTANSRLGRREYSFGGPVQLNLQPAADLKENQVRIRWLVGAAESEGGISGACLELIQTGRAGEARRWTVSAGTTSIGRYDICDIYLDQPEVQERRLISGQHATLRGEPDGRFRLYDGSPTGKPSRNGTFVNGQRIPPEGQLLQDGDLVLLASPDPLQPRPGTPGTATFMFYTNCPQE